MASSQLEPPVSYPPDAGLLATLKIRDEFLALLRANAPHLVEQAGGLLGALGGAETTSTTPTASPGGSPYLSTPTTLLAESCSPRGDSEVLSLAQRVAVLEQTRPNSPAARRPKRPTKHVDMEDGVEAPAKRPRVGMVTELNKLQRDDFDERVKTYLQSEVRKQMYALIGYEPGGVMASKDGPYLGHPGQYLVPNFPAGINDASNVCIQGRAAKMVLDQETAAEGAVPKEYRASWLYDSVLRELARLAWPNMRLIWTEQAKTAKDGGKSKMLKARTARRNERRKTRASQLRLAILPFCDEHILDYESVKVQLVHADWTGEEWSCDEDGTKNAAWRDRLYQTGKISLEDRDDPDIDVLEEKRPIWMDTKLWDWQKNLLAATTKKSHGKAKANSRGGLKERKRVDLGRVSHMMPLRAPYNFMLDREWKAKELPKYVDWNERPHYPSHVYPRVCDMIVTAPSSITPARQE
ncbi:hypothetical protein CALVIDRAFT_563732 [Calocera viscosa TUFC12733]|uniref:Uncharacterized protein n=1 Tax=Calocera viscosa (strain TUFC12733) TaxID=1330018 RepID=A0A167MFI0_CALVF|nr:hypothetical protein CALVIDRAFT_563732 [Calocera viscosa TUFC12733]